MKLQFLIVLMLLAFATSASAECAWVLWGASIHANGRFNAREYQPVRAYVTAQECFTDFNQAVTRDDANKWVYVCLPDTVDPRGPKGSGR